MVKHCRLSLFESVGLVILCGYFVNVSFAYLLFFQFSPEIYLPLSVKYEANNPVFCAGPLLRNTRRSMAFFVFSFKDKPRGALVA